MYERNYVDRIICKLMPARLCIQLVSGKCRDSFTVN